MVSEEEVGDTVRKPIDADEAAEIIDWLKDAKAKSSNQWKARANAHQAKLEDGDPRSYAEVYKNLRARQADDKLSVADRRHLKKSARLLSEELGHAMGTTARKARRQIAQVTRAD